jgi:UDP-glucose 4-epimerase
MMGKKGVNYFITGGAGFIGSNLVDRLLQTGHHVTVYDNFSTGQERFLDDARKYPTFTLIFGDTLDQKSLTQAMEGAEFVFHLAANADVRFGTQHPFKDLEQNTISTFNVLEAMRSFGVNRIAYASTGSIYGESQVIPTPEDAPFPIQTSLYGASKLAGEGLIEAYCEGFGLQGYIFRFVSILGERYTHGHVYDFYEQLRKDTTQLHVLGDGHQRKSYLYVQDCLNAMLIAIEKAHASVNIFNLGTDEHCQINDSIRWITEYLDIKPELFHSGGVRGWVGDNPFIFLDCRRIQALGWTAKCSIRDGVIRTLSYLENNPWLLEERGTLKGVKK